MKRVPFYTLLVRPLLLRRRLMKRVPFYTLLVRPLLLRRRLVLGRRSRREFSNQKPLHDDVPLTPFSSVRYG